MLRKAETVTVNVEVPKGYPRCRFCGAWLRDGDLILEDKYLEQTSTGLLSVCRGCAEVMEAVIRDALPCILDELMKGAKDKLSMFDCEHWQKYVKPGLKAEA